MPSPEIDPASDDWVPSPWSGESLRWTLGGAGIVAAISEWIVRSLGAELSYGRFFAVSGVLAVAIQTVKIRNARRRNAHRLDRATDPDFGDVDL